MAFDQSSGQFRPCFAASDFLGTLAAGTTNKQLLRRWMNRYTALGLSETSLVLSNGEPVPDFWATFQVGETVVVKGAVLKVAHVGRDTLVLEPIVGALIDGPDEDSP